MDGLLIDWGGVLTTSVFDAFTAFSQREGLAPEAVLDMFRHEPHLVDLESGHLDLPLAGVDLRTLLSQLEDRLIGQALARTGGNKNRAAELLGMNRTTLVEKLRRRNVA